MKDLQVNRLIATLFAQRGITDLQQARRFCRPALQQLHDPFLMQDMYRAVDRLHWAIRQGESIMLYGDYDVDGTSATALMYRYLRPLHPKLFYYTPNRHTEGYGLSIKGIEQARQGGCKLIVALDCGMRDVQAVDYANRRGIDIIICDHHLPGETIPAASAVLNPKRTDCSYPYKNLSGCGVAFKLTQAYSEAFDIEPTHLFANLDLVALSIACDIVPIDGENRILAYYGLKKLKKKPTVGLEQLLRIAGFANKPEVSISDLVFGAGPRINAAGRLEHALHAIELLISDDPEQAYHKATYIHQLNSERKQLDEKITREALQKIEKLRKLGYESLVLFDKHWHTGIVGIVAARCAELAYRPTVVLTQVEGKAIGSARSINGFDLYSAIDACSDLLDTYGGHAHAAGLSLAISKLDYFRERFEQVTRTYLQQCTPEPILEIDAMASLDEITYSTERLIGEFAPFGPANPQPLLASRVELAEPPQLVGSERQHLRLRVRQPHSNNCLDAIAFRQADWAAHLQLGQTFYICYHLEQNEYRGHRSLQLRIKDIQIEAPEWKSYAV